MNKNMYYEENRNLEDEDIGFETPIYKITIFDNHFLIAVGKERKLLTKKNHYYFPVYLMNNMHVQTQIGALEFESIKETADARVKPFLINSSTMNDMDLNRLGDIIFYSFADYDFFQNINVSITPAALAEMETKYAKLEAAKQATNEGEGEQEDITLELEVFELGEEDLKLSKAMIHSEKVLKEGVFEIDRTVKPPMMLPEESKQESLLSKKDFTEHKNASWIESYMKNSHYDIVETDDNGDCLFDTIRVAYEQIGYKTTIKKLRALVAKEATEEMFNEYHELYQGALGEKSDIEKEMRRLVTVNKELKKRLKTIPPSEKEARAKIMRDANEISAKHKDLKEQTVDNTKLLSEFAFMTNVDSLERLREYIQTPMYWADNWAISVLERELNMKLIIFSESSYDQDDKNNVLQCTMSNLSTDVDNFSPDFYIFTTYSGLHYRLITYKNKRVFKFAEIPYDIKIMVVIKCMERNSGIFNKIQDFRNFKSKLGIIDDTEGEEREEREEAESSRSTGSIDKETVLTFYNKSNALPKPGKGSNEKISASKTRDYSNLALKKNADWRKKLDDDWATFFTVDNMKWQTVEHYYQAAKFKKHNPHFYKMFSLDSNSDISKDIDIAKAAGGNKGAYKKGKTEVQLRPLDVKIDPDFYGTRKYEEREKALYAKFSQNEDLKEILLATNNAVLQKHVPKSKPEIDILLMNTRKKIQTEHVA